MRLRTILALLTITIVLMLLMPLTAQDEDATPTAHWCFEGQRWGDGRCNHPDPFISAWYWGCGWYGAQHPNNMPDWCTGEITHSPSLTIGFESDIIIIGGGIFCGGTLYIGDSDCDLLQDTWEMTYFGNLAQNGSNDPDGDTCDNQCEQKHGTIPINPDTDGDGIDDGTEITNGTDPLA